MKRNICVIIIAIVSVASARRLTFNDPHMPIRFVDTSYGDHDHERVTYLEAEIHPQHVNNNGRLDFPSSGHLNDYFLQGKAPGDERGHLVGSQFSGPAEWYNLTPQNERVNRNKGFMSITTDWYGAECEVREFLDKGGNRYAKWTVTLTYLGKSNRPTDYHLKVEYHVNGRKSHDEIDALIHNPTLKQDSTFWICRECHSNSHDSASHCSKAK